MRTRRSFRRIVPLATALLGLQACGSRSVLDDLSANPYGAASGAGGTETTTVVTSSSVTSTVSGGGFGGFGDGGQGGMGGIVVGIEDCLDNTDNDGDGFVDCADPDCGAFECVEEAPPGWAGPVRLHEEAFPQPCSDMSFPEVFMVGPAGPAECTACSCAALEGASCNPAALDCFNGSSNCGGGADDWTGALDDGDCHKPVNLLGFNNQLSCSIAAAASVAEPGKCAPSPTDFPNKGTWQTQVATCGAQVAGGGCGMGEACIAKGLGDPTESLCVRKDGMDACPAGWSIAVQSFASGVDARTCSACDCAASTTCAGDNYTFFDVNQCGVNGNVDPIAIAPQGCTSVTVLLDQLSWSVKATLPVPSGTCAPSGGQPIGAVEPEGPVVFCCK